MAEKLGCTIVLVGPCLADLDPSLGKTPKRLFGNFSQAPLTPSPPRHFGNNFGNFLRFDLIGYGISCGVLCAIVPFGLKISFHELSGAAWSCRKLAGITISTKYYRQQTFKIQQKNTKN